MTNSQIILEALRDELQLGNVISWDARGPCLVLNLSDYFWRLIFVENGNILVDLDGIETIFPLSDPACFENVRKWIQK